MRVAKITALVLGLAVAGQALAQAPAGDAAKGKGVFDDQCSICHTTGAGEPHGAGPNLHGVAGRKAGTAAGYGYSDELKKSGVTWDDTKLDAWVHDPQKMIPGVLMASPPIDDAKQRADLVAYLKSQS